MTTLTDLTLFTCPHCPAAFGARRPLRDHLIAAHGLTRVRAIVASWSLLAPEECAPPAPPRQRRCSVCGVRGHKAPTCPTRRPTDGP